MPFGSISSVDSAVEFLWPQFRQVWSSATEKISRQQIYTELLFLFFSHASAPEVWFATNLSKGRTIRKLMGGAGEVQKKNSRKGKLNEKKFLQAN